MIFGKKITLLPVLIFVVFLAFSLRLVEVTSGASSLTQAALAEIQPQAGKEEADLSDDKKDEKEQDSYEISSTEKGGVVFADDANDDEMEDVEMPKWMDANDSDLDQTGARIEIIEDLSERRQELEGRENSLITREALLKAAEKELDRKYQELSGLRQEIEKLLMQQSEEEQQRITSLVKIYEGMKPKDAARIFNTLDLDILVAVMSQMSERRLSPVLAAMNAERARTITIMLAEQKQLPTLLRN